MVALALELAPGIVERAYRWKDPKQDREIPVRVTYPVKGDHLPVIVFSHGLGGSENIMKPLTEYWARHGYVVFQPRHEDSLADLPPSRKLATLRSKNAFKSWRSRLYDCEFIYSVCHNISKWVPELQGRIESNHIIQAGHSFGAHTTMVLGGTRLAGHSFSSSVPMAFCCISPQGVGERRTNDSWKDFKRPLLVVSGSKDITPLDDAKTRANPEVRQDPYKLSPPGNKFLLWIVGASHNFGGITGSFNWPGAGEPNPQQVEWVQRTTVAFFDAYAKRDGQQMRWIKSNNLAAETKGDAVISWR